LISMMPKKHVISYGRYDIFLFLILQHLLCFIRRLSYCQFHCKDLELQYYSLGFNFKPIKERIASEICMLFLCVAVQLAIFIGLKAISDIVSCK
jgi:hypothetical protein